MLSQPLTLMGRRLHQLIIELHEMYILINFNILDTLKKSVLQLNVVSINFGNDQIILTSICTTVCPQSIKFAVLVRFELYGCSYSLIMAIWKVGRKKSSSLIR